MHAGTIERGGLHAAQMRSDYSIWLVKRKVSRYPCYIVGANALNDVGSKVSDSTLGVDVKGYCPKECPRYTTVRSGLWTC